MKNHYQDKIIHGDCLEKCKNIPSETYDLIYLDPPFYSQKEQKLNSRDGKENYAFEDRWATIDDYRESLFERIKILHFVLKKAGSIVVHCDSSANYIIRKILDDVFGYSNFRSEIIWHYKRWTNSQKCPIPNHQTIFVYSKNKDYKYNQILEDYAPTTNIDQILQARKKDHRGKSVYARDEYGNIKGSGSKRGVPISDVWTIPFLNPKAKERVGYPTQKPLELLERIIKLYSDENDLVLDPYCGSGTTLVAAKLLNRKFTGIDISKNAILLAKKRLEKLVISKSNLIKKGLNSYINAEKEYLNILTGIDLVPVQRNKGIDAIVNINDKDPALLRIQRFNECIQDTINSLNKASINKKFSYLIVVQTTISLIEVENIQNNLYIINSAAFSLKELMKNLK